MIKKIILAALALLSVRLAFANPIVNITVDQMTPTTITCSFAMNDECTAYYIVASEPESIEPWIGSPFGGATLEETIVNWGIEYTHDATYTWEKMAPNTTYVVYVAAKDASGTLVLYTDTVSTPMNGGHGESIVTVTATDITNVGATTTATPNDQTAMFKDLVINKWLYDDIYAHFETISMQDADELTTDSLFRMLMDDPYEYYTVDQWVWNNLEAGTEYFFIAVGMNADSVWGELAMTSFTTLGGASIADVEKSTLTVYPNPATEYILVKGAKVGDVVTITDLSGRVVATKITTSSETRISLEGITPGVYVARTRNAISKVVKN